MKKIKELLKNDKTERALKTFIEAFASYIAVNIICTDLSSIDGVKAIIVGALASAISVAINSLKREEF